MTKAEQRFFNKWKKDGLQELAAKRKQPKATAAQQALWAAIINGER